LARALSTLTVRGKPKILAGRLRERLFHIGPAGRASALIKIFRICRRRGASGLSQHFIHQDPRRIRMLLSALLETTIALSSSSGLRANIKTDGKNINGF
jgi:hypothetical protein